jgi:DNA-binding PadR family transcriptional regulator
MGGTFQVKPGSLFPALHRMEEAGWLISTWGKATIDGGPSFIGSPKPAGAN